MKDIFLYLPSKVLPGVLSYLSIMMLTRALSVNEFGQYSYYLALASFVTIFFFNWLTLGLNRHYFSPDNSIDKVAKGTVLTLNICVFACLLLTAVITNFVINDTTIWLILLLAWLNGLFELLQQSSILERKRVVYSFSVIFRPLSVFLAAAFSYFFVPIGAKALIVVIIGAYLISCLFLYFTTWREVCFSFKNKEYGGQFFRYGMPLVLNFGLMYVVSTSDKLLIEYFFSTKELGIYSASYDLFSQIVFALSSVLTLVLYPKSLRAFNNCSEEFRIVTIENFKHGGIYLFGVVSVLIILSPWLISVSLASEYIHFSEKYFALIVIMTAIYCFYSYALIPILQLKKQVGVIVSLSLVMAVINFILNYCLMPIYGIGVGIYSTLAAYISGLVGVTFIIKKSNVLKKSVTIE